MTFKFIMLISGIWSRRWPNVGVLFLEWGQILQRNDTNHISLAVHYSPSFLKWNSDGTHPTNDEGKCTKYSQIEQGHIFVWIIWNCVGMSDTDYIFLISKEALYCSESSVLLWVLICNWGFVIGLFTYWNECSILNFVSFWKQNGLSRNNPSTVFFQ